MEAFAFSLLFSGSFSSQWRSSKADQQGLGHPLLKSAQVK